MVRQGLFREDLFYRLSTIRVDIPSLRKRGGDVDLLAKHFITVLNDRFQSTKTISAEALLAGERAGKGNPGWKSLLRSDRVRQVGG